MEKETIFVARERPRGDAPKPQGWIKSASEGPGSPGPSLVIKFAPRPDVAEEELLEFEISNCADEKLAIELTPAYRDSPDRSFVFDARYLFEPITLGSDRVAARSNLRAALEAYEWWRANRVGIFATFFCVSGQNRSATVALVFSLSAIADAAKRAGAPPRRSSRDPPWRVSAAVVLGGGVAETLTHDGSNESMLDFLLRALHEIRPRAFKKKSERPVVAVIAESLWKVQLKAMQILLARAKEDFEDPESRKAVLSYVDKERLTSEIAIAVEEDVEPLIDWSRLWVGRDENKIALRMLDAALRVRLYGEWFEGERWLEWQMPPRLIPVEVSQREGKPKKAKRGNARAKAEEAIGEIIRL